MSEFLADLLPWIAIIYPSVSNTVISVSVTYLTVFASRGIIFTQRQQMPINITTFSFNMIDVA